MTVFCIQRLLLLHNAPFPSGFCFQLLCPHLHWCETLRALSACAIHNVTLVIGPALGLFRGGQASACRAPYLQQGAAINLEHQKRTASLMKKLAGLLLQEQHIITAGMNATKMLTSSSAGSCPAFADFNCVVYT